MLQRPVSPPIESKITGYASDLSLLFTDNDAGVRIGRYRVQHHACYSRILILLIGL
jgi:hypothetical protein